MDFAYTLKLDMRNSHKYYVIGENRENTFCAGKNKELRIIN